MIVAYTLLRSVFFFFRWKIHTGYIVKSSIFRNIVKISEGIHSYTDLLWYSKILKLLKYLSTNSENSNLNSKSKFRNSNFRSRFFRDAKGITTKKSVPPIYSDEDKLSKAPAAIYNFCCFPYNWLASISTTFWTHMCKICGHCYHQTPLLVPH